MWVHLTSQSRDQQEFADGCLECSTLCTEVAQDLEAREGRPDEVRLAAMLRDCADVCEAVVRLANRGSSRHILMAEVCAEVCETCAEECDRPGKDAEMRAVADACRKCADMCRALGRKPTT